MAPRRVEIQNANTHEENPLPVIYPCLCRQCVPLLPTGAIPEFSCQSSPFSLYY